MRNLFFLVLVCFAAACQNSGPSSPAAAAVVSELFSRFQDLAPGDTLYVSNDDTPAAGADTIPLRLLWSELDSALLQQIAYGPDSSSMVARALGCWTQDSTRTACRIRIDQNWWKFQYLLIYDRLGGVFTGIQPLSEFYGGEGGQIASVSWLFDRDGDGDRDLVTRSSEHMLEMPSEDTEPVESNTEEANMWQWENGGFRPVALLDSAAMVKQWVVDWGW